VTDDLTACLRAALDETERVARATSQESWEYWSHYIAQCFPGDETQGPELMAHMPPSALLRMVAAHRKLLDMWQLSPERELQARIGDWSSCSDSCPPTIGEYVLATLAEAYRVEA
jgi:hypothetical protein